MISKTGAISRPRLRGAVDGASATAGFAASTVIVGRIGRTSIRNNASSDARAIPGLAHIRSNIASWRIVVRPDAALMLRVQRGDRNAFEQLVDKYKQPVINLVYRTLGDATEAEDVAQNVFVQVYKSADRYRDVLVGPDGRTIYLATDSSSKEHPGAILAYTIEK